MKGDSKFQDVPNCIKVTFHVKYITIIRIKSQSNKNWITDIHEDTYKCYYGLKHIFTNSTQAQSINFRY